jgi:hypothetical protein
MQNFESKQKLTSDTLLPAQNISVMKIQDGQSVAEVIQNLQDDPNVEYVQPNFIYTMQIANPNDTFFASDQRWLKNIGQTIQSVVGTSWADIERSKAMDVRSGNSNQDTTGTIVAIIDDGLWYTHPEFNGQLWNWSSCLSSVGTPLGNCSYGYDVVDSDTDPLSHGTDTHGTHIAWIIWAKMNNSAGTVGVSPGSKIMGIRAGNAGTLTTADVVVAISFATHNGARIINASRWGTGSTCDIAYDISLYQAIRDFPWLFISSAGNAGHQHNNSWYGFPADYNKDTSCWSGLNNMITVAASTSNDGKANFSDYGANINLAAPWVSIASTIFTWEYAYMDGTSMATPFVAAVTSLARSMRPELSYLDIKSAIINQAESISAMSGYLSWGKRLNAFQTLQYLYQVQIGWLSGYIGTWVGNAFVSGAYISGTKVYFQRNKSYYTGTLSGYYISITLSGQSFLETGSATTWLIISLSGDGKYIFSVWPLLTGGATGNTLAQMFWLDNVIPQSVSLQAPTNNQIRGYQPMQFSWSPSNEDALTYFYEIILSWSTIPSLSWSTQTTGIILNDTISNGIYYWNVRPQDSAGHVWLRSTTGMFLINAPDVFAFSAQTEKNLSTDYQSNEITVSGLITWTQIDIIGGTYAISGWAYTWSVGQVVNGDKVQITLTSSPSYSTTTTATLTIWWRTGVFSITTKANPGGWGGGWWGGGGAVTPTCSSLNLRCVNNVYILKTWANCQWGSLGQSCAAATTGTTGSTTPIMYLFDTPSKSTISNSPFSTELTDAYIYAYDIGITTVPNIEQADITGTLLRKHLAKMISNFAIHILHKSPNTWMLCNFDDMWNEKLEMIFYAKLACQLGLMWRSNGNIQKDFYPNGEVTRAQFGTVLSRALRWDKYNNDGAEYFTEHLNALNQIAIMKNINDPFNLEIRWYVMLMMMRTDELIQ